MKSNSESTYSALTHLSSFFGYLFPFANIIIPWIMWSAKKEESNLIDNHGKSVINFQLSITLYMLLLCILIIPITIFTLGLGLLAILAAIIPVLIFKIAVIIMGALKATNGETYQYPFTINFIS